MKDPTIHTPEPEVLEGDGPALQVQETTPVISQADLSDGLPVQHAEQSSTHIKIYTRILRPQDPNAEKVDSSRPAIDSDEISSTALDSPVSDGIRFRTRRFTSGPVENGNKRKIVTENKRFSLRSKRPKLNNNDEITKTKV